MEKQKTVEEIAISIHLLCDGEGRRWKSYMTPLLLTYYYGSKNMKEQQYFVFFKPFSTAPIVEMTISSTVFCFSVITDRKGIAEDIFITSSFISTQNV